MYEEKIILLYKSATRNVQIVANSWNAYKINIAFRFVLIINLVRMKRKLKRFLNKNLVLVKCFLFVLMFVFMANGYSILNSNVSLNGSSTILEEDWKPQLRFDMTYRLGNTFFYDIVIYNDSPFACKNWQIKFFELDYISIIDMLERR